MTVSPMAVCTVRRNEGIHDPRHLCHVCQVADVGGSLRTMRPDEPGRRRDCPYPMTISTNNELRFGARVAILLLR